MLNEVPFSPAARKWLDSAAADSEPEINGLIGLTDQTLKAPAEAVRVLMLANVDNILAQPETDPDPEWQAGFLAFIGELVDHIAAGRVKPPATAGGGGLKMAAELAALMASSSETQLHRIREALD